MNPINHNMQDVPYTHGYYRELSPTMIATALEMKGLRGPDLSAPLNYCELGMGFGVSLVAHAACFPNMRFFGNDFNAQHASYARDLALDAGLKNVEVFDDSFEQMLDRDLPSMDFIVLHGVYSWISPELRQVLARFIAKRLKLGGVVYVSHNALPGWAPLMPLRELFHLHGSRMSPPHLSSADRFQRALEFVTEFAGTGLAYFESNPAASQRLDLIESLEPRYMAHEYFNAEWHPQYFHEVAQELSTARLSYAAPARLHDHVEAARLSAAALEHLATVDDPILRETWCDYRLNTGFRRDLYTRGAAMLSAQECEARRLDRRWALITARADLDPAPPWVASGLFVDAVQYASLLDALAEGTASARDLLKLPAIAEMGSQQVINLLMLLSGAAHVQPALPETLREAGQASVERFNAVSLARGTEDGLQHLASSRTGQATGWTRLGMLQISLSQQGVSDAESMAQAMWSLLSAPSRLVSKQGRELSGEAQIFPYLLEGSRKFLADEVPILRRLGVS